ncbi:MAG: Hsp70 family protein, partial [Myxococcota bacterium]
TATTGLRGGEQVLIADVGGGTTDFTLIQVRAVGEDGRLDFERSAVGEHLLLGGDNMDLALSHAVEPDLTKGKKLDAEGWAQLKLECRTAKETLFEHPEQGTLPITVTGRGRKLLGGAMRAELDRAMLERVVLEGYYPALPAGPKARPEARKVTGGFSEYGLPYASDPRITRHLAAFLMRHAAENAPFARVDAVLFNGGALKPTLIRDRITEVVGDWMRATLTPEKDDLANPRALVWDEGDTALELAVARGAAYFGLVREGLGLRVGGGSPREYFLGLGAEPGEELPEEVRKVVCIAPRGMQEGQSLEVSEREFQLVTNRPVAFPLFATTSPREDPVGSVLTLAVEELHELPPLQTVIKFGKQKAGTKVPVRIQVRRTELGTLELSCLSKMSGARFKLEFDLRAMGEPATPEEAAASEEVQAVLEGAGGRPPPEAGEIDAERLEHAKLRIDRTFAAGADTRLPPAQLMKGIEEDLGLARDAFPLTAL